MLDATRIRYRNWLSRRAWQRGRTPLPDRIASQVASRVPGYRNRVNPATGRPHRDDRTLSKTQDRAMAEQKASRERTGRAAAANQQFVRDTLRQRYPSYARQVEQAARDAARQGARRRSVMPARGRSR